MTDQVGEQWITGDHDGQTYRFRWMLDGDEIMGGLEGPFVEEDGEWVPTGGLVKKTHGWWRTADPIVAAEIARGLV